jgi:hexokinase
MTLNQIPTYVTGVPNGTEKGLYMAVDLGGTNFRVCSILLHGDTRFTLTQSKVKIPDSLMKAKTSGELFSFLAKQIEAFLREHHNDHYECHKERKAAGEPEQEIFDMGFTFSFPVQQVSINKGYLIRWTKGFDIKDTVGKDVCGLLQAEIDALHLPVRVAALVNDTVGTLMARGYTSPGKSGSLLGAIFGTGTNGAYLERNERIVKMKAGKETGVFDASTGYMVINTEWGSFDNKLLTLPNTPYDASLDKATPNPGIQMFEKRISGMYLGEILRRALLSLIEDPDVPLFRHADSTCINKDSQLYKTWGLDSSFLSTAAGDTTSELRSTRQAIERDMNVDSPSAEDAAAVRLIANAIGKRAARLAAVAVGAIVIASGKLDSRIGKGEEIAEEDVVDIGVDGSLVEFYPGFEEQMREA